MSIAQSRGAIGNALTYMEDSVRPARETTETLQATAQSAEQSQERNEKMTLAAKNLGALLKDAAPLIAQLVEDAQTNDSAANTRSEEVETSKGTLAGIIDNSANANGALEQAGIPDVEAYTGKAKAGADETVEKLDLVTRAGLNESLPSRLESAKSDIETIRGGISTMLKQVDTLGRTLQSMQPMMERETHLFNAAHEGAVNTEAGIESGIVGINALLGRIS